VPEPRCHLPWITPPAPVYRKKEAPDSPLDVVTSRIFYIDVWQDVVSHGDR
jgi:hypothetical protein